jgi:hypothetical protein
MGTDVKPQHRSGYSREETAQVEMVCLTVIGALGAYVQDLCVVGGLVPPLLIDCQLDAAETVEDRHPGTNDFDIGFSLALLDEGRYAELSKRLRAEGFGPDTNDDGNEVRQRWRLGDLKATVDFLMAPPPGHPGDTRLHDLEPDLAVLVAKGLGFAFDERVDVVLDGHTIKGEKLRRAIPVCGPGAFLILKALAFGDRLEHKDAYDLVYVLRRYPGAPASIARRLAQHAVADRALIESALQKLAVDFGEIESIGPQRAAEFVADEGEDLDPLAADAHGYVDDLLSSCRAQGLAV